MIAEIWQATKTHEYMVWHATKIANFRTFLEPEVIVTKNEESKIFEGSRIGRLAFVRVTSFLEYWSLLTTRREARSFMMGHAEPLSLHFSLFHWHSMIVY
jgi:hypothetical protein